MRQSNFDEHYAATQLARRDNAVRAWIKQFYLKRILLHVKGRSVDIGCGAGQLLAQLREGSIGLEINPSLIADLRRRGLDVLQIKPVHDAISLGSLEAGRVQTAVLSHVLEHFDDAATVLRRLMQDCVALGISRLIIVVPGEIGYRSDLTHKTFVTLDYLDRHCLLGGAGFAMSHHSYFPLNLQSMGRVFVYHELMVVYDLFPQTVID